MPIYKVYVIVDETDQHKYHFVGVTAQHPVKRVSDLISEAKLHKRGSRLHLWIKDLIAESKRPMPLVFFEFTNKVEAEQKMFELVIEYLNTQHPIKNAIYNGKLRITGRPLKEQSNDVK